jgi:hypothetical protein
MNFGIWDTRSGNVVGSWGTQAEALRLVRDLLDSHGPTGIRELVLAREDDTGETVTLAEGIELLQLIDRPD